MQLLNPAMLITLGFLGPLVLIYMLRKKYKEVQVPSNFIWSKLMEKKSEIKKVQKLKTNLLFFIQLLVIILLALAMSKLVVNNNLFGNKHVLVIVDNSVSASSDERKFNEKKKFVEEYLEEKSIKDYHLVIFNSAVSEIENNEVSEIDGSIEANDYKNLKNYLEKYSKGNEESIVLFTDDNVVIDKGVLVVRYPSSGKNLGISAFVIDRGSLLVEVKNYGNEDVSSIELNLINNGEIKDYGLIDIKRNSIGIVNFDISEFGRNDQIQVDLNYDDEVYFDNNINIFVTGKNKKVLIANYENPFLVKALESIGSRVIKTDKYSGDYDDFDYIISLGELEDDIATNTITIAYEGVGGEKIEKPEIFNYSIDKEYLKFEDSAVVFEGKSYSRDNSIMGDKNKSVVFYEMENNNKHVYFTFDLINSDLILKPGFVMMMDNIINGDDVGSRYRNLLKSQFDDILMDGDEVFTISDGRYVEKERLIEDYYKFNNGKREEYFALNIIDDLESSIFDKKIINLGTFEGDNFHKTIDLSNILILIVLILMIIEWWLYYNEHKI